VSRVSKHCQTCSCDRVSGERSNGLALILATIRQLESERIAPTVKAITARSGAKNQGSVRAWLSLLAQGNQIKTQYPYVARGMAQEYHTV
jgi:hypothetical protein